MVRYCWICEAKVERPGSEEILAIYKRDEVTLCVVCLQFYKTYKGRFTGVHECGECFHQRQIVDGYCGPCWMRWDTNNSSTYKESNNDKDDDACEEKEPSEDEMPTEFLGCTGCGSTVCNAVWTCPQCTIDNICSFKSCVVCGEPKPPAAPQDKDEPTPSVWTCKVCSLDNDMSLTSCVVCEAKPAAESGVSPPNDEPPSTSWECGVCTLLNDNSINTCLACDNSRPQRKTNASPKSTSTRASYTPSAPSPTPDYEDEEPVIDGWACSSCTYINMDTVMKCAVCDTVRDESVDEWFCPHCTVGLPAKPDSCPSCGMRPEIVICESWECSRCHTENDLSSQECSNCHLEKSWTCSDCTLENVGGTHQCSACNSKRKAAPPKLWKCQRCTLENPPSRTKCQGCGDLRTTRKAKVMTLNEPMEYGDKSFRPRKPKGEPKQKPAVVWTPPAGSGPRPSGRQMRVYNMAGRYIMMVENLKKSDKVNNHALRLAFDRLGASNVQVLIKDGRKTGKAVVEFDTADELKQALTRTKKMTLCESKINTHRIDEDEFKTLPETWTRGKQEVVARPSHIPVGAKATNRVAVCFKVCPVGAINYSGVCKIDEDMCTGCNMCMKKRGQKGKHVEGCPFDAIIIVNIPKELTEHVVMRYGKNGFTLCHLPLMKQEKLLGIIGENGSGKSTALKILSGKLVPNSGTDVPSWQALKTKYKGTELQALIMKLEAGKQRCSFKVQHIDKLKDNVEETVQQFLETFTGDDDRIETLVKELSLQHLLKRPVKVLSGGELQRVSIAAACAKEAEIYLFDEPSSYLDVKQRLRACEVIRDLLQGMKYVVCVEHDLAVCDYLADTIALIHGKPSAFGIVTKVMNVRDGINAFLEGYIDQENVRFRSHPLVFKMHEENDFGGEDKWSYPSSTKCRGDFKLDVTNGTLNSCEVTALLGENGCGKTTLLEIMSGSLNTDSGDVFLKEHGHLKPQVIRMPSGKTVKEVLQDGLPESARKSAILRDEVLLPLKIDDLMILDADKLSGGEMQRVSLALALGNPATLLLIDEPSAFLDAEQRMVAAKAIRRIAVRMKKIVVVVEHDLMMTSFMADRVVVFEGTPGVACSASRPEPVSSGLNRFLRQLDVTVRLDAISHRPRFNKRNSVIDRDQRSKGEFYADAAAIKDKVDGIVCETCESVNPTSSTKCTRCGLPLNRDDQ